MTTSTTELKPCPFCGSAAVVERQKKSPPECPADWWIVQCVRDTLRYRKSGNGCPGCAMAIGSTESTARKKWNTRSAGKAVPA